MYARIQGEETQAVSLECMDFFSKTKMERLTQKPDQYYMKYL